MKRYRIWIEVEEGGFWKPIDDRERILTKPEGAIVYPEGDKIACEEIDNAGVKLLKDHKAKEKENLRTTWEWLRGDGEEPSLEQLMDELRQENS